MDNEHVTIVVLQYNGYSDSVTCIKSLLQLQYRIFSILVVDNLSTDQSFYQLQAWAAKQPYLLLKTRNDNSPFYTTKTNENASLHFIQSGKNGGYAFGNNAGIKYSLNTFHSTYFWILNNDTTIAPDTLQQLVFCARDNPSAGSIGALLYYQHKPHQLQHIYGGYNYKWGLPLQLKEEGSEQEKIAIIKQNLAYIHGASMLIPSVTIKKVGLLNEAYFFYFEELDYAERIKKANLSLAICEKAIVYHKNGEAFNTSKKHSPFVDYHFVKSKLIFTKLHNKKNWFTNELSIVLLLVKRLLHLEFQCAGNIVKAMLSASSKNQSKK